MMAYSDQQNYFETDAAQAKRESRALRSGNKNGNPINLYSKLNAAIVDPAAPSSSIYAAGSDGWVRRVDVDAGKKAKIVIYRGPQAPITSVAVGGPDNSLLFAGCWDRNIWSWDISTRQLRKMYTGHSDFVKAVVCAKIGDRYVLISGGADRAIMVWDIESAARMHAFEDITPPTWVTIPMLAVQHLAVDPVETTRDEIFLVSASSDPHIRRWRISLDRVEMVVESDPSTPGRVLHTVHKHHTGIYKLVFDREGDEIDLWTSSADGTAKCLSRINNFATNETYKHGDYVRAVAFTDAWVVTAGRDENVKVWDRATGEFYLALEGHFDEITDLVMLQGAAGARRTERVVSVSIDGTVRTWAMDKKSLDKARVNQEKARNGDKPPEEESETKEGMMTADEEAELAELMEDDN